MPRILRRLATSGRESASPTASAQILRRRPVTPGEGFRPLPAPAGPAPYRRALAEVLSPDALAGIARDQALRFHCLGDTGGWRDPLPQDEVAAAMVAELAGPAPASFLYHLGDIVYPHGDEANYGPQFFVPYRDYDAPIFAIPGNHDGEAAGHPSSLEPFVRTFCSSSPPLHDAAVTIRRPPPRQPNVYWTLVHDWVWIIGLYTNVHEDGEIDSEQLTWLADELRAAPTDVTVIVAVHRPVYSVDVVHGSNLDLGDALDAAFTAARRTPDAVLAAHAHNYQRFARQVGDRSIPYVVAGSGGFHERHAVGAGLAELPAGFPALPDVTLQSFHCAGHGFMTVTVAPARVDVVYRVVADGRAKVHDAFAITRSLAT